VDVSQDIVITEHDCGTLLGIDVSSLKEGEKTIEQLRDRIVGRTAAEDVIDEQDNIICEAGQLIDVELARKIEEAGVETLRIRSVLTCRSPRGICALCYGYNLAEDKLVDIGEPCGVIAAQSIGEPGTQLTLRTFHIGGTASRIAEQNVKTAAANGQVVFQNCELVIDSEGHRVATSRKGEIHLVLENGVTRSRMTLPYGAQVLVKDKQKISQGDSLFEWDPFSDFILSEKNGVVEYVDIIDGVTLSYELDEKTRMKQPVVKESNDKTLHPAIRVVSAKTGKKLAEYIVPTGAFLLSPNGQDVKTGTKLAKILRDVSQTGDITGGLPRVAELFEARKPRDAAIVTEIDGVVQLQGTTRGMRRIVVVADDGTEKEYLIPHGKHVRTYEGERVVAGDRLTEGPINPMDILAVKGVKEVQTYLVNAIQEVYRLQGVKINDKHIEVVVSRMLQKVMILNSGDTEFLEDEQVLRRDVESANERIMMRNMELRSKGEPLLEPATFRPLLLGITKASLSTDSFISAASFQETTRVLTDAATRSKRDELRSLKENVIMGHLISAGTGLPEYQLMAIDDPGSDDEDQELLLAEQELEIAAQAAEMEIVGPEDDSPEAVTG
jgi:DNA-directed RNA polymerase subunit beta'